MNNTEKIQLILFDVAEKCKKLYKNGDLQIEIFGASMLLLSYFIFPIVITGILFGVYVTIVLQKSIKNDVITEYNIHGSDKAPKPENNIQDDYEPNVEKQILGSTLQEVQSDEPNTLPKYFRGYVNLLNEPYDPLHFIVDHLQTVLLRVEGNLLIVGTPEHALRKHAYHDDRTFNNSNIKISREIYYDLTDAKVVLRPKNLARRRWFTRKYPICVKLLHEHNSVFEDMAEVHTQLSSEDENSEINSNENFRKNSDTTEEGLVIDLNEKNGSRKSSQNDEQYAQKRNTSFIKKYRNLYIFCRSAREKEHWFHALCMVVSKFSTTEPKEISDATYQQLINPSSENLNSDPIDDMTSNYILYMVQTSIYEEQMNKAIGKPFELPNGAKNGIADMNLSILPWKQDPEFHSTTILLPTINILISRFLFDLLRDDGWYGYIQELIQQKVSTIHLPAFIKTLELTHLDVGTESPLLTKIFEPIIDEWGIWVDFEFKYEGSIKSTIKTHADLVRCCDFFIHQKNVFLSKIGMTQQESHEAESNRPVPKHLKARQYWDEDVPESLSSSPAEVEDGEPNEDRPRKKKFTKKLSSAMKKITRSKLAREIKELKPIKCVINTIADEPIFVTMEIEQFEGRFVLNIPPPPSERLWWSFRLPPSLHAEITPQIVGLDITILSDAIVNLIYSQLEHLYVWPNMENMIMSPMQKNKFFKQNLNL